MRTSEEACLEALHDAAQKLGESPTKRQYEQLGMTPAASTIIRVVGGWNEAKSAAGLETTPGRGPRVAAKPAEVDLPEGREWEDLTQDQRWHYKHTEWNTQRTLERRQRHREWLNQLKRQSGGCRDCEVSDPTCLDFHHVEPAKKTMAVNELVLYGYSKERIRGELDTCVFLCANCHRIEHANRSPLPDDAPLEARLQPDDKPQTREAIRNWTRRFRASLGCADCGEKDVRCLMFHHAVHEMGWCRRIDRAGNRIRVDPRRGR